MGGTNVDVPKQDLEGGDESGMGLKEFLGFRTGAKGGKVLDGDGPDFLLGIAKERDQLDNLFHQQGKKCGRTGIYTFALTCSIRFWCRGLVGAKAGESVLGEGNLLSLGLVILWAAITLLLARTTILTRGTVTGRAVLTGAAIRTAVGGTVRSAYEREANFNGSSLRLGSSLLLLLVVG